MGKKSGGHSFFHGFFGSSKDRHSNKGKVSTINKNSTEDEGEIVDAFKRISLALYNGQNSFLKRKSPLLSDDELSITKIEKYLEDHPNGRSAMAWELAQKHYKEPFSSNKELFKAIHQYSFKMSSTFFGLFKRSANFPNNSYENNLDKIIEKADKDSRTGIIRETLDNLIVKGL